jgi:signal transduction histidine kinase
MGNMQKLLNKTVKIFAFYALLVLAASVPAYYYLVEAIWLTELDDNNVIIARKVAQQLSKLDVNNTADLNKTIDLWAKIQYGSTLVLIDESQMREDSIYTILRQNDYQNIQTIDRFRVLSKTIAVNGFFYRLEVETNIEETEEMVIAIALVTVIFFIILIIGFLLLNRALSIRIWQPFRDTLAKLKKFNLNTQTKIDFKQSDILEFEELHQALSELIAENITIYAAQKEFTENASHELQTPLAIIKNKLDLLLQDEILTDRQYQIIEDMNKALNRISRINKNLLLLAKIEHQQFIEKPNINISLLLIQCLEQIEEYADDKNIIIQTQITANILQQANKILVEILFHNLLLNAVRYTPNDGTIKIVATPTSIFIANSGIEPLHQEMLFRRFANTTTQHTSTGLGLYIIKEICHRHTWQIKYNFENQLHYFHIFW